MKWKKKLQQPQYALNSEKVFLTATQPAKSVYSYLQTTRLGLTRAEVEDRQLTKWFTNKRKIRSSYSSKLSSIRS